MGTGDLRQKHINPRMPSLTADEIKRHPEYGTVVWDLEAAKKGTVSVAKGRGGPFDIAYEVHGTGPLKLVVSSSSIHLVCSSTKPRMKLGQSLPDVQYFLMFLFFSRMSGM